MAHRSPARRIRILAVRPHRPGLGVLLGDVEPKLARRLVPLISSGNRYNAAVARETTSAYGMPFATGPDTVARAIERAIEARRPRTRYAVTSN